jgi:hypothetical protein
MFDSMKTQSTKKTSVWIGDLYHNPTGGSRGKWFELSDETTVESLQREVNAMLAEANDSFPHTRYFIGKSKNIPIFSAHQNLESLLQVASLVRIHGNDIVKGFMDWAGLDAVFFSRMLSLAFMTLNKLMPVSSSTSIMTSTRCWGRLLPILTMWLLLVTYCVWTFSALILRPLTVLLSLSLILDSNL